MGTTDQTTWTKPWLARLFPLDEWSIDGRRVRGGGEWRAPVGGGPVTLDPPSSNDPAPVVGRVDRVWVEDCGVYASGVVDAAVELEGLRPQADLGHVRVEPVDLCDGGLGCDIFGGDLRAVRLSSLQPCWSDLWIAVGKDEETAIGAELPDYLQVTTSDRGFDRLPPIPSTHGGPCGEVRVYESSSASAPHLWLAATDTAAVEGGEVRTSSHLRAGNALRLAAQLVHLVREHYHHAYYDDPLTDEQRAAFQRIQDAITELVPVADGWQPRDYEAEDEG